MIMRQYNYKFHIGAYLGISILLILCLYLGTVQSLLLLWGNENNPTYSHGLLLFVVTVLILVREWVAIPKITLSISYVALAFFIIFNVIMFLSILASIQVIQMLMLSAIIAALFWSILGLKKSKPLIFAVLLMITAMPVWEVFGGILQQITAVIAGELTIHTIMPSLREGMYIIIPAGSFEVAIGCSGLNYFIVSIIISLLFCYINDIKILWSLFYVSIAAIVAIISNIIRVYIIIVSGQITDMQSYFITVDHVMLGWVVFAIAIALYLWVATRTLSTSQVNIRLSSDIKTEVDASSQLNNKYGYSTIFYLSSIIFIVLMGPMLSYYYTSQYKGEPDIYNSLPDHIPGWDRKRTDLEYKPNFMDGLLVDEALFVNSQTGNTIYSYTNYFYHQRQGSEAISDVNSLSISGKWSLKSESMVAVDVPGYSEVFEGILESPTGKKIIVWQWYKTNNKNIGNHLVSRYENIKGYLTGNPDITVYVIAATIKDSVSVSRKILENFIGKMVFNKHISHR